MIFHGCVKTVPKKSDCVGGFSLLSNDTEFVVPGVSYIESSYIVFRSVSLLYDVS